MISLSDLPDDIFIHQIYSFMVHHHGYEYDRSAKFWFFMTASLISKRFYILSLQCEQAMRICLNSNTVESFLKFCKAGRGCSFRKLSISYATDFKLTTDMFENLLSSNFCSLKNLDLGVGAQGWNYWRNEFGAERCRILTKYFQTNFPKLEKLSLISNQIGLHGCVELDHRSLKQLTCLQLDNCDIYDEACMHLAQGNLSNLTKLGLYRNSIGDEGCKYLSNGKLVKLKYLYLSHNKIGTEGCQHIGMNSRENLPALEELTLLHNKIDDEGCKHLSEISTLKYLSVGDHCTDDACTHLAKLQNLTHLDLSTSSNVGCSGFSVLMTQLTQLTSLDLSKSSQLNDAAIESIDLDCFKRISTLKLSSCSQITNKTSQYLINHAQYFSSLKTLYIHGTEISDDEKKTLRSKFPDLYIDRMVRRVYPSTFFNIYE
ncbi:hypothetical protein C9374_009714 [Naegleria lovaniensis]|uniref:Uncharacterized protein n=1 Tax=Naegleria lovaniensis TaxID=51637 RepID=A0AA88H599_NAELO|nr:uncharacterized protein C9374_009714 [Naegleria lovaniensis]KAG2393137.1 hypothetical protein C9374_009714 [Naegleria lovaniensis]